MIGIPVISKSAFNRKFDYFGYYEEKWVYNGLKKTTDQIRVLPLFEIMCDVYSAVMVLLL